MVVNPQPGRLVGEQAEGRRVRLGEAEAGEAHDLLPDRLGDVARGAALLGAGEELLLVGADGRLGAAPAHRAAQPLGLPRGEAGERHRHLEHLVLEDDRAERVAQHRLERRVLVGHLVRRIGPQRLAPLDVRVHGPADDRPRPHERHLHGQVVERRGPRPLQHLHLRARLDLEHARGLGLLDARVDLARRRTGSATGRSARRARARSRRCSARPPTASPARAGRSSGSPRRRTSPCPTAPSAVPPSRPAGRDRGRSAAGSR